MKRRDLYRVVDANFNRCREGLRVCEEVARFLLNDAALTRNLKKTRHAATDCLRRLPVSQAALVSMRDVERDVGKEPSFLEAGRKDVSALFLANIQRVKESLRVLEETLKLIHGASANKIKKIRFDVYAIEKKILPKLETLRHYRPR